MSLQGSICLLGVEGNRVCSGNNKFPLWMTD